MRVAIIGAGVSGLSAGQMLKERGIETVIYEASDKVGGLVKCEDESGHLFHLCGGHVFNTKRQDVDKWFWKFFDRDREFISKRRKSGILMGDKVIGYPIEDHIYQLDPEHIKTIIRELWNIVPKQEYNNFVSYLQGTFGETLYNLYFKPYNEKIWGVNLSCLDLTMFGGKLPSPEPIDAIYSNIVRQEESSFVHSSFYYPFRGGSQFIADRLSKGLTILLDTPVVNLERFGVRWCVNKERWFDAVIYTGNLQDLNTLLHGCNVMFSLPSNGTTSVLCTYQNDDESTWIYVPGDTKAHRIIYTGNLSPTNNTGDTKSCIVEFSGKVKYADIERALLTLPGGMRILSINYTPVSYVMHVDGTREKVMLVKEQLAKERLFLCGRLAEWEYYNMDGCMASAMKIVDEIFAI